MPLPAPRLLRSSPFNRNCSVSASERDAGLSRGAGGGTGAGRAGASCEVESCRIDSFSAARLAPSHDRPVAKPKATIAARRLICSLQAHSAPTGRLCARGKGNETDLAEPPSGEPQCRI